MAQIRSQIPLMSQILFVSLVKKISAIRIFNVVNKKISVFQQKHIKNLSIERPMLKRNVLRYMELFNCQPKVKNNDPCIL